MTIHDLFQRLAVVLAAVTPEDREEFKQTWLKSAVEFDRRTEEIRYENWKRS